MRAEFFGIGIFVIPLFVSFSWYAQLIVLSGVFFYLCHREPTPKPSPLRSIPHGYAKAGETVPRRNLKHTELLTKVGDSQTVPDLIRTSVDQYGSKPFVGSRKLIRVDKEKKIETDKEGKKKEKDWSIKVLTDYQWQSFDEIGKKIDQFGAGVLKTGLKPKDYVAIFAETRAEWMVAATACMSKRLAIVTVYASLGEEALGFSFDQTDVTHVITEAALIPKVIAAGKKSPKLKTVIYFDKLAEDKLSEYGKAGYKFYSYDDVLGLGVKSKDNTPPPKPRDLAIIMYTSGSTGPPKGVMVTHANFLAVIAGMSAVLKDNPRLTKKETYLAYLPLAHILELACEIYCMSNGWQIGYGSTQTLKEAKAEDGSERGDIVALQPSVMAGVPLILDRFRSGVTGVIKKKGPLMATAFKLAYHFKRQDFLQGNDSPTWDKLVFGKIQEQFGGKLKLMLSGGAPLSKETHEWLSVVLNVSVLQGYGLTETCAGGTITDWDDRTFGHVGAPVPCCEIKLKDCKDLGYTSKDTDETGFPTPRGEILIRGGNVSKGYFKLKDKTKEAFVYEDEDKPEKEDEDEDEREEKEGKEEETEGEDEDQQLKKSPWFYTGDIGVWLPDGTLKIIDRKKDLQKLRHGEYIALGNVESVYKHSQYVENIAVHVNPHADAPVALVSPNEKALESWAHSHGVQGGMEEIVKNEEVKKEVLKSLLSEADSKGLKKYERVAEVILSAEAWTAQNGLLTEAMKIKRKAIEDHHKKELEQIYKKMKVD